MVRSLVDGVMWVGRAVVFTVGLAAILALLLALAFVTLGRRLGAPAHTPTVHSGPRGYTHEPDPVPDSSFPFPHHPQGHRASPTLRGMADAASRWWQRLLSFRYRTFALLLPAGSAPLVSSGSNGARSSFPFPTHYP